MGSSPADAEVWLGRLPHGVAALLPVRDAGGRIVDFRYDYVNAKVAQIFGYEQQAMEGRLLTEVHHWPEVGVAIERLSAAVDGDAGGMVELRRFSGGVVTVATTMAGAHLLTAVRDPRDDTGHQRVLRELLDSIESSADFVAILDPVPSPATGELVDFRIRTINDAGIHRLGLRRESAVGGFLHELLPGMADRIREAFHQVAVTGVPFIGEDVVGGDHYLGTMRLAVTPFEGGLIVTSRDTSAEHQTRAALAASEAQFRATVEALYESIFVFAAVRDAAGALLDVRVELVNDAAVTMVCRPRSELIGLPIDELFPWHTDTDLAQCLAVIETGQPTVLDIVVGDGPARRTFEAKVARSGDGLVVAVQDVSDLRQSAEQLADSERRYRLLADNAGDVVLLARDGRTEWIAPSVELLVGYTPAELAEVPLTDWVHVDDLPAVVNAALSLAATGSGRARLRAKHRDGHYVWVEAVLRAIPDFDEQGDAVIATAWDVSAQVEAEQELERAEQERRAQEERIQQAMRLESLGVMAGGIAHDFNNLLVGVLGNAEMALHSLARAQGSGSVEPVTAAVERLGNVVLAAQRAADLTRQLLDYAGRRPRGREAVDLCELVDELPVLVGPRLGPAVELVVDHGTEPVLVLGDRNQLQQVLMNLVINAGDAVGDRSGRVLVRLATRVVGRDAPGAAGPPDQPAVVGTVASVEVSDDGAGIEPDALGRIFDPFFTTRSNGRGLGLAVVHGVVRSHAGRITVASELGAGTTMTVLLPTTDAVVLPAVRQAEPVLDFATAPRALVIDDDEDVAEVSAMVLRTGALEVDIETDPVVAIERFRARPDRYGVVLLDLAMPIMRGDQVLAALRAIDPAVPVVVVSGYSEAEVDGSLEPLGVNAFVRKPYRAGDLLTTVVAVLRPTPAER